MRTQGNTRDGGFEAFRFRSHASLIAELGTSSSNAHETGAKDRNRKQKVHQRTDVQKTGDGSRERRVWQTASWGQERSNRRRGTELKHAKTDKSAVSTLAFVYGSED